MAPLALPARTPVQLPWVTIRFELSSADLAATSAEAPAALRLRDPWGREVELVVDPDTVRILRKIYSK